MTHRDPKPDHAASGDVAARLEHAAGHLPTDRDPAAVARIMHAVRSRRRRARPSPAVTRWRPAWLAGAAAAVAGIVVAVVVVSVHEVDRQAPAPSRPLVVQFSHDIDPLLARTENDLDREISALRADLDQLSRMMTIRLESDTE